MITSGGIQVGWGEQWETLANAINDYYGGGIASTQYQEVVQMLNSGEYTMEQMESILSGIPEFNRTYNANGQLTGVSYNATATGNTSVGNIANEINSNVANGTNTQFSTVQTITKDAQTGKVTISDNVTKYNSGVATQAKAVAASAVQGVVAASVGITVGKTIAQLAYDKGFNYLEWAGVSMEDINPATWGNITAGDNSAGAKLFNFIFQIDPNTGNPQAYIDQYAFAYMTSYMGMTGVFDNNHKTSDLVLERTNYPIPTAAQVQGIRPPNETFLYWTNDGVATGWRRNNSGGYEYQYAQLVASSNPNAVANSHRSDFDEPDGWDNTPLSGSFTHNDLTVYYTSRWGGYGALFTIYTPNLIVDSDYLTLTDDDIKKVAWTMVYGLGGVEGISNQGGSVQFDPSGINDFTDIDEVLQALQNQYPELWENRIETSPDGETIIQYIPVGFPTGGLGQNPTTDGASQSDLAPDISGGGENSTDELIKTLIELIQNPQGDGGMDNNTNTPTEPIDPNGDGTGSGNTPAIVLPTGEGSALYSIYNPTQAQVNSFGAWLWSSNFVDQLKKIFNDPMQAIIGLHKVFATPPTSGAGNIKVGYLDSGVSANLVSAQYTEVNCGKVKLSEYFKNALDYLNTDVYLYLPFVGIVPLDVVDVMRASIEVKYKVDVLTGACLAVVNVYRDSNAGGQLYTYSGNCAVQYPISSGSYMGIVAGALSIAGSIAGTIVSHGAMLPMALTAGAGAMSKMRTNVERSGSLSGNAGAMGVKNPYLIIRRPQTKIADNFNILNGISNNVYGVLSSFTGETRVKYVHLENIPATTDELTEIQNILESGVLI